MSPSRTEYATNLLLEDKRNDVVGEENCRGSAGIQC